MNISPKSKKRGQARERQIVVTRICSKIRIVLRKLMWEKPRNK
jgi:hypothetical protein